PGSIFRPANSGSWTPRPAISSGRARRKTRRTSAGAAARKNPVRPVAPGSTWSKSVWRSVAVDFRTDDGNSLLVDAGRIPALDGAEIGLARLVAAAGAPAVAAQEVCGGGERIGLRADEIDAAVAVAVDAVFQD